MKTYDEMFRELIHYGDYDYLAELPEDELKELYNRFFGE